MQRTLLLNSTFALGLLAGACRQDDPHHCANKGGDAYCQEKLGLGAGEVFCTQQLRRRLRLRRLPGRQRAAGGGVLVV